jgi:hypothetical protein
MSERRGGRGEVWLVRPHGSWCRAQYNDKKNGRGVGTQEGEGKDEGWTLMPESDAGKKVVSRRFQVGTLWEKGTWKRRKGGGD